MPCLSNSLCSASSNFSIAVGLVILIKYQIGTTLLAAENSKCLDGPGICLSSAFTGLSLVLLLLLLDSVVIMVSFSVPFLGCRQSSACHFGPCVARENFQNCRALYFWTDNLRMKVRKMAQHRIK